MSRPIIAGIVIILSLLLLALLFFAPWLAADPGAYVPPWLESLLGVADAASGNVVTDVVGGLLDLFGAGGHGGGGGGLPIDLKSIEALRSVMDVLQHEGRFTAWSLFRQSFITGWIKISLGAVGLTAVLSLITGALSLLGGSELVQVAGWLGATIGAAATVLMVGTMPALLRLGAGDDIGMALITAVFNVHLGYGFWLGLVLIILLTGLNIIMALAPPISSRYRSSSRTQYRYR